MHSVARFDVTTGAPISARRTRRTPLARRTPRGLAAPLAAVGALAACSRTPPPPPPIPTVTVAPAVRRDVTDWSDFTGQFAAVQAVEVRPRVSGYILRVGFREGSEVRQGDTLFVVEPRPYAATLASAEAQLARARSALQLATAEDTRAQSLFAAHAMSREDLETRANAVAQAQADVRSGEAAVDTATLNLQWTVVRAPIAGRVSRAAVTPGNYVQSGVSVPPLTTIVSQDPIYVYFNVDEQTYLRSIGAAPAGRPVAVGLADETGFPHTGRIDFVDNQLDGATGTIRVRAVLPNPDRRLTPGLFARVHFASGHPHSATLVEDRAIGTDQDKKYVYVVKADSAVEYRPVQLGQLEDGLRVVTGAVAPGERVVVEGLQRVRPGAKVVAQLEPTLNDSAGRPTAIGALKVTTAAAGRTAH